MNLVKFEGRFGEQVWINPAKVCVVKAVDAEFCGIYISTTATIECWVVAGSDDYVANKLVVGS